MNAFWSLYECDPFVCSHIMHFDPCIISPSKKIRPPLHRMDWPFTITQNLLMVTSPRLLCQHKYLAC
uniref:Uncharacterized protein n=1 Tax=Zea mays TaxID=4577 RepID=C4J850_MAIZE|nr:unknown [Zea mays]